MSEEESPPSSSGSKSSNPPKDTPKKLRNFIMWANASKGLLTASAALIAAGAAFFKPQDHTVTKNSYETTAAGIAKLEKELQQDHEDIVVLRGYINGVIRKSAIDEVAPAPSDDSPAPAKPRIVKKAKRVIIGNNDAMGGMAAPPEMDSNSASIAPPAPAAAIPPLPPVHDAPTPWQAPAFDAIMKQ